MSPRKRLITLWHVDLTAIPTGSGFWVSWFPGSLPQSWPFCWWVAVALDHFSRRVVGFAVFKRAPTSNQIPAFLGRAISKSGGTPKYLICDKGTQFFKDGFKAWRQRKGIKPRYGAIGQHASLAILERFILTLKQKGTRRVIVPLAQRLIRQELKLMTGWYDEHRPHMSLDGKTPNEVYFDRPPANEQPRWEPRPKWPTQSPCAQPQATVNDELRTRIALELSFYEGRKHLPVIRLKPAA